MRSNRVTGGPEVARRPNLEAQPLAAALGARTAKQGFDVRAIDVMASGRP